LDSKNCVIIIPLFNPHLIDFYNHEINSKLTSISNLALRPSIVDHFSRNNTLPLPSDLDREPQPTCYSFNTYSPNTSLFNIIMILLQILQFFLASI